jgi:hypothetical protein
MVYSFFPIFITGTELDMMKNKLLCSFTTSNKLIDTVASITSRYAIMYDKMFVLESPQTTELLITYNIDTENSVSEIPENTILLHRKKESNTLYTINALNTLIKHLNNGLLDSQFKVNWLDYRNSVLLTQGPDLRIIETKIHKIIHL